MAFNSALKQAFEATMNTNKQLEIQASQNKESLQKEIAELQKDVVELKGKNDVLASQLKVQEAANNKA